MFLFLGLALFSTTASAQDKGIVKFLVEVDNGYFEILVNDTLNIPRFKDTLPVGDYKAKVWSPGYVLTNVDFSIRKDLTTEVHVKMPRTNDYIDYERDYRAYRLQFHKQFSAPLSLSIASGITAGALMINAYDRRKDIFNDIDLYQRATTTSEIDEIKQRIADNNKKYNRQRTGFYIFGGITAVCAVGTIFSLRNFNQNYTEPVFSKESPFKDRLSMNFTPYGGTLTLKL